MYTNGCFLFELLNMFSTFLLVILKCVCIELIMQNLAASIMHLQVIGALHASTLVLEFKRSHSPSRVLFKSAVWVWALSHSKTRMWFKSGVRVWALALKISNVTWIPVLDRVHVFSTRVQETVPGTVRCWSSVWSEPWTQETRILLCHV